MITDHVFLEQIAELHVGFSQGSIECLSRMEEQDFFF